MSAFLNGFHFYADDMGRQVEANHFCTHLTEDFHRCAIYDFNRSDAKLIGIEYIVSARIFRTLPEEEWRLWHSHDYEVRSGELIAPDVPEAAGHAVMHDLDGTYGKTWQIDRSPAFPMGIPQLMMGFVKDGQVDPAMVADRDRRYGTDTAALRRDRAESPNPRWSPVRMPGRAGARCSSGWRRLRSATCAEVLGAGGGRSGRRAARGLSRRHPAWSRLRWCKGGRWSDG